MWVDHDNSELICTPRYLTDDTLASEQSPTKMMGGGIAQPLFLDMIIEQHFAGCSERLLSLIQVATAVTSH